eukprot:6756592-Pyramimonas_sp.AAC.1
MIGSAIFSLSALIYTLVSHPGVDWVPFVLLTVSAWVHVPFSVLHHLFIPIGWETNLKWIKLDVQFIFVSSCFLTVSLAYFVFPWWGTLLNLFPMILVA